MRRLSVSVALMALIGAVLAPPVAGQYVPDPDTVLLDHLDGATQGQAYGSPSYVPSLPSLDDAVDLGLGDYIRYTLPGWYQWGYSYNPAGKAGTVEAWVRPRNYGVTLVQLQWSNSSTPAPAGYIGSVGLTPDGHLYWTAWSSIGGPAPEGPPTSPTGSSVVPLGEWTHVAVTWSPVGTSLYVNGVLDGFTVGNWYPALNATFYVYLDNWGVQDLGALDELRISRVARSEADIRAHVLETLDTTNPTASPEVTPAANAAGWNNTDVTVAWNWTDNAGGWGIDLDNCGTTTIATDDGAAIVLGATCFDLAGNSGSASATVNIDKTDPTLSPVVSPNPILMGGTATVASGAADTLSGLASESCGALDTTSVGAKTVTCTATDKAGNASSVTVNYAVRDSTPPVIIPTVTGTLGDHGWYTSDVSLTWDVSDPESAVTTTGCVDQDITSDQAVTDYSCSATSDGGSTGPVTVAIKRDATAPSAVLAADRALDHGVWYTADVTVSTSGTDSISGPVTCSGDQLQTIETTGAEFNGSCTNDAGLSTNATPLTIKLDKTGPGVSVTGVTNGATYLLGAVPAAACATTDAMSGVAAPATLSAGYPGGVGSFTVTCSGATDNAGNTGSASVTISVAYDFAGFFQPVDTLVWNMAKAGQAIPVKFSLVGDQGLSLFRAGFPKAIQIACPGAGTVTDAIETYADTAGGSTLSYDATSGQYNYVWKTEKAWVGKCFLFDLGLKDGSSRTFRVQFKK